PTRRRADLPPSTAAVRPVRRPLPDHLPREVRKVLPKQEACPDCGGKLKHLGEDVSEIATHRTLYCARATHAVAHNMSKLQVRRLLVLNRQKRLVGIVSLS